MPRRLTWIAWCTLLSLLTLNLLIFDPFHSHRSSPLSPHSKAHGAASGAAHSGLLRIGLPAVWDVIHVCVASGELEPLGILAAINSTIRHTDPRAQVVLSLTHPVSPISICHAPISYMSLSPICHSRFFVFFQLVFHVLVPERLHAPLAKLSALFPTARFTVRDLTQGA